MAAPTKPEELLTPRQLEILRLMSWGMSASEAACYAGCSEATARTHLRQAYRRLDVGSAIDAFRRLGWLSEGPAA